jgi:hypothetical protein
MKDFLITYKFPLIFIFGFLLFDAIVNYYLGSIWGSLVLGLGTLSLYIYLSYQSLIQLIQAVTYKDGYLGLRYIVFYTIIIAIFLTIPGIIYNVCQLIGFNTEFLKDIVRTTNALSRIIAPILIYFVSEYERDDA